MKNKQLRLRVVVYVTPALKNQTSGNKASKTESHRDQNQTETPAESRIS